MQYSKIANLRVKPIPTLERFKIVQHFFKKLKPKILIFSCQEIDTYLVFSFEIFRNCFEGQPYYSNLKCVTEGVTWTYVLSANLT